VYAWVVSRIQTACQRCSGYGRTYWTTFCKSLPMEDEERTWKQPASFNLIVTWVATGWYRHGIVPVCGVKEFQLTA